jgi:hypothetical protein
VITSMVSLTVYHHIITEYSFIYPFIFILHLSGLCLCKGEAKIGPGRPFAHTKHMGDWCRGLTAHSTLRVLKRARESAAGSRQPAAILQLAIQLFRLVALFH